MNDKITFLRVINRIVTDTIIWAIAAGICLLWRLAADKLEVQMYAYLFLIQTGLWIALGLITTRYFQNPKKLWFWQDVALLLCSSLILWLLFGYVWVEQLQAHNLSLYIAEWMIGVVTIIEFFVVLFTHYYKYALNLTVPAMQIEQRENATVTRPEGHRSFKSLETIHQSVLSLTTEEDFQMLLDRANLDSVRTKIVANRDRFSFLQIPDYQYSTLVDLTLLNDAKGINRRFCIVNQKLPDNGRYVCCYRPQEYMKNKILTKYPPVINWIIYTFYFIHKRVIPRLMLTSRLYYDVTKGRKRMLSKTEVFGRLYYCGFVVEDVVQMGHIDYVFARRKSQPYPQEQFKVYGPLIKLARVCKDEQIKFFYKFRTMHPYAEYIQDVVFDEHGGMNISDKGKEDWRITNWGRFMRKFWIDELPMVYNWLRGDVKLVGVRPLSRAMFAKYPVELQKKRTKSKPGLIPPFYIDHPQTFDELFASENKYLDEYFRHPFLTDWRYFWQTIYAILFKRMHSA